MAILLAILSTCSIGIGEFLAGDATKKASANQVTSAMFASGVALTGLVALLWPGEPTGRDLVIGAFAGATNGAGILLLYMAYSRGSLRSAAPAAAVVMSGVPVAWDVLISGTSPTPTIWSGIILGLIAIALSSYERGEDDQHGVAIAIAAGLVFGVLLILLGEIGHLPEIGIILYRFLFDRLSGFPNRRTRTDKTSESLGNLLGSPAQFLQGGEDF